MLHNSRPSSLNIPTFHYAACAFRSVLPAAGIPKLRLETVYCFDQCSASFYQSAIGFSTWFVMSDMLPIAEILVLFGDRQRISTLSIRLTTQDNRKTFVVFSDDGCEERIRRSLDPLMPGIPGTKDEPFKKPGVDSGPSWPQKNQHQGGRLPAACTQRPSLEPTTLVERSGWVHDSSNDPVLAGGLKRGRKKIAQDASEASLFTGRVVCANQESRRVLPSRSVPVRIDDSILPVILAQQPGRYHIFGRTGPERIGLPSFSTAWQASPPALNTRNTYSHMDFTNSDILPLYRHTFLPERFRNKFSFTMAAGRIRLPVTIGSTPFGAGPAASQPNFQD
ncbi:uncharacterized protein CLUP02_07851 [Colletotrichum lupini]|uniref:Uncharacterized protein n=1 Tax=Colletotrichum lupini TaxID=145971 RepID=A0A9Q8SRZ3_9PEZI|nr:uncharacterized protein CLUP02_07851 [Colletotrichum lupini]UQC82363.1 hypothetical protein CLUP02_07851 [Colletotrichum lupini]